MTEENQSPPPKNLSTHDPDDAGLISMTIPSLADIILPIFGGCCCVMNCDENQKNIEKNRTDPAGNKSMGGGPCCPETNPPVQQKGDQSPAGERKKSGICQEIELQMNLHGNIYLNFAFAFEPILDIPPGLPAIPGIGFPLFGIPSLNLPGIPLPPFPGMNLPGFPLPGFDLGLDLSATLNLPSLPGLPFFTMTLGPINLGLDLFKLKLPDIPDFDLCEIAKFIGQLPPETDCGVELKGINFNIPLCYLMILLFFLMLIQPILVVLLGMKEKGMVSVDESEIDPEDPASTVPTPPVVNMPPRISIVHSESGENEDNSLMIFKIKEGENKVTVNFTLSPHTLNEMYHANAYKNPLVDQDPIVAQAEPNVEIEESVLATQPTKYTWTIHGPDFSVKEKSNESPTRDNYAAAFNAFKDSLVNPKSLEERKIHEVIHEPTQGHAARHLSFDFENEGLYEIYCTIERASEEPREMLTFVQIGKPKLATELPPILQAMPRPSMTQQDSALQNKTPVLVAPADAETDTGTDIDTGTETTPPAPSTPTVKKGI